MKTRQKCNTIIGIIILSMVMLLSVKAQSPINNKESARVFVQKFYDWYAVMDADENFIKKHKASPCSITVNTKGEYFDVPLRAALLNYFRTPLKGDEIGLDFDPISAAQDTRSGFQTGDVREKGSKFFVDVHDIKKGQSKKAILSAELALTAEVINVKGSWRFVNFIYPTTGRGTKSNLLDLLNNLRKEHDKTLK